MKKYIHALMAAGFALLSAWYFSDGHPWLGTIWGINAMLFLANAVALDYIERFQATLEELQAEVERQRTER